MAEGRCIVCTNCARSIEAWDEGRPYYRDARGRKRYAFHPQREHELCTHSDDPTVCLACGHDFLNDSAAWTERCPRCASAQVAPHWELDGRPCPYCRTGTFATDPTSFMIS